MQINIAHARIADLQIRAARNVPTAKHILMLAAEKAPGVLVQFTTIFHRRCLGAIFTERQRFEKC
jgi:hypothetical protein